MKPGSIVALCGNMRRGGKQYETLHRFRVLRTTKNQIVAQCLASGVAMKIPRDRVFLVKLPPAPKQTLTVTQLLADGSLQTGNQLQGGVMKVSADNWYTTQQIAKFLECSDETIRKRIVDGTLKAVRLPSKQGRSHYRVQGDELLRFIGEMLVGAQTKKYVPELDQRQKLRESLDRLGLAGPKGKTRRRAV